jgi:hypothetical protein
MRGHIQRNLKIHPFDLLRLSGLPAAENPLGHLPRFLVHVVDADAKYEADSLIEEKQIQYRAQ